MTQSERECRRAQKGEEILWRAEAKRMAFTTACRTLLGDIITDEDIEHLLPCEKAIGAAFFELVWRNQCFSKLQLSRKNSPFQLVSQPCKVMLLIRYRSAVHQAAINVVHNCWGCYGSLCG